MSTTSIQERVTTVYKNKGGVYVGKYPPYWQKLTQVEIETSHIRRLNTIMNFLLIYMYMYGQKYYIYSTQRTQQTIKHLHFAPLFENTLYNSTCMFKLVF